MRTQCGFLLFFVVFFVFMKAQEIDVPLASTGPLATESELHMFSLQTMQRCAGLGWVFSLG